MPRLQNVGAVYPGRGRRPLNNGLPPVSSLAGAGNCVRITMAAAGSPFEQDAIVSGLRFFGQIRPRPKQYPEIFAKFSSTTREKGTGYFFGPPVRFSSHGRVPSAMSISKL